MKTDLGVVVIDAGKCSKCGMCVEICPNRIFEKRDGAVTTRADRVTSCFSCGQCMAGCPSLAVHAGVMDYDRDFFPLPEPEKSLPGAYASDAAFEALIMSRRAVRSFRSDPVPREMLERIVAAIKFAPPSFPPLKTDIVVVGDPALIKEGLPHMVSLLEFLYGAMQSPMKRMFIKREIGPAKFRSLDGHLIPLLKARLPALKAGTENTVTRDAPAMILFLAEDDGEDYTADIYVAAAYGMLAAHAYGLGGSIMDIIPPAINKKKELRALFKIPDGKHVVASIILGYPKYRFKRGIRREHRNVEWL